MVVLVIFPVILQTVIINVIMLSIGGQGEKKWKKRVCIHL